MSRRCAPRYSSFSSVSGSTTEKDLFSKSSYSTPRTSSVDASSVVKDAQDVSSPAASPLEKMRPDETQESAAPARSFRTRRSQHSSYNEVILSGRAKSRRKSIQNRAGAESGDSPVHGPIPSDESERALEDLVLVHSMKTPSASVRSAKVDRSEKTTISRRFSTRLEALTKVKDDVKQGVTALGKRGSDAISAGKKATADIASSLQRRASLRPRAGGEEKQDVPEPARKKARLSDFGSSGPEIATITVSQPSQPKKKTKMWLSHGLYLGQDRDFDPRLSESKNKIRAASRKESGQKQNSALPLPMFAGERLLENGRDFKLPFFIFSPLPPGQPKPEEWKKTQKNVFVGEAASLWKKTNLQEVSKCICTPDSECGEDCQNRFMFYECDDNNCNIGAERCTNRSFEDLRKRCKAGGKYNIGVEVIKTSDRGYGVRSNRQFEPHQIIVEYAGEIITQEECDNRMNTRYKDNACCYLMQFDQNMIIDATRGSIARFVNHSCEPNCEMVKWIVAGKPRMALFAGENGIMTGDELTYDYNFDPFSVKNVQECRCGSATCRGYLGPKPKETKPVLSTMLPGAKTAQKKVSQAIVQQTPTVAKVSESRRVIKRRARSSAVNLNTEPLPSASKGAERTMKPTGSTLGRAVINRMTSTRAMNLLQKRRHVNTNDPSPSQVEKATAVSKLQGNIETASATLRRSPRASRTAVLPRKSDRSRTQEDTVRLVREVVGGSYR